MKQYDYLIVGAGLWGSMFAYRACKAGKKCLVIDRNSHIGGGCYTYTSMVRIYSIHPTRRFGIS